MKSIVVAATLFATVPGFALAAPDTGLLAEGCASLKNQKRKAACLDEVEKLKVLAEKPAPPPEPAVPPKTINFRGYMCERVEFAELNSMDFYELESMYCSALAGSESAARQEAMVPDSDVNGKVVALRVFIAASEKCRRLWMPVFDLAKRKFSDKKFSCAEYPKTVQQ